SRRERVVDVGDRHDPHGTRDLVAAELVRVARPVELFMMRADARESVVDRLEMPADLPAVRRVALTTSNSSGVSGPGLLRIASGHPIFPTSWRTPPFLTASHSSWLQPTCSASWTA